MNPSQHCIPYTNICHLMSEWGIYWQATSVIITIFFGIFGLYKIHRELIRFNEQRQKEIEEKETYARLKRTEFFLAQHRRLFDNLELYSVLTLIDSDHKDLRKKDFWDKKRKFLTFIEEIALLVKSKQIDEKVALYMFGYYAVCAKHGANFLHGINVSRAYWALFYDFSEKAEQFMNDNPAGPPDDLSL